jgi:AraC family transcriptional regulator, melibiose operon regulatory protein
MVSFDPNRPDFAPYGFSCVRWTPSPMKRPDHHNEIEVNVLTEGYVTYLLGGRKVRIEGGQFGVFWAAIPHQILEFSPGINYFVATIPFAWFLQCQLADTFVQPLLRGEVLRQELSVDRMRHDQELFAQWEQDLVNPDGEAHRVVMLELEARLRRMISSLPNARSSTRAKRSRAGSLHGRVLSKVEQMACLIARRYTERLTVEEIGRQIGLHPNYAMGLFKKTFGTTLIDYLTHHRVSHAQRLLATTDEKIVEIAFASGFNSISRFNEAFRRECGCTPRAYRLQHATKP